MIGAVRSRRLLAAAALVLFSLAPRESHADALPGEIPLEDLLQILVVNKEIISLDARGGSGPRVSLLIGEQVLENHSRGRVGVVLTDQRMLAVSADSGSWQELRYRQRERLTESPLLGDRVALLLTNLRVIGFDGGSGNLIERRLGPGESALARAVGANVAVAVTGRRAVGISPFRGGFFEVDIRSQERLESVEAASNLATVRTSRRLLTFRAPSGSWSEKRIGLGN